MAEPEFLAAQVSDQGHRVEFWYDPDSQNEFFRVYLDAETSVEIPARVLPAMMNAARGSNTLPVGIFGDTTDLVQRLDRLLDCIPVYARRAA